ncbi:hypothetical protein VNI00_015662 [Paramarasmius palmivorus]|uniref:F-box domain-containing protein n=1 Tax=Paramarasmius palmivorus TaxID=297713 RepID=A0AAW0BJ17_9AGAR
MRRSARLQGLEASVLDALITPRPKAPKRGSTRQKTVDEPVTEIEDSDIEITFVSKEPDKEPITAEPDSEPFMTRNGELVNLNKTSKPIRKPPKKPKGKGAKSAGKLSMLPNMPVDILFTIFRHLSLGDLVSLARVNHLFRDSLTSPGFQSLWITQRKMIKLPEPAPGMTELQWAALLFGLGNSKCQRCAIGMGWVQKGTGYYPIAHIDEVLDALHAFQTNAERKEYVKSRREYLLLVAEHAQRAFRWLKNDHIIQELDDKKANQNARMEGVKKRLLDLGYTETDMKGVKNLPCVRNDKPFTNQSWASIKHDVLRSVRNNRKHRLSSDDTGVLALRFALFSKEYEEFRLAQTIQARYILPDAKELARFQSVVDTLIAPDGEQVSEQDIRDCMGDLQTEFEDWVKECHQTVASKITGKPDALANIFTTLDVPFEENMFSPDVDASELAITAVSCSCGHVSVTAEAAVRHLKKEGKPIFSFSLGYDTFVSAASVALVKSVGATSGLRVGEQYGYIG